MLTARKYRNRASKLVILSIGSRLKDNAFDLPVPCEIGHGSTLIQSAERKVRIHLPPAKSHANSGTPGAHRPASLCTAVIASPCRFAHHRPLRAVDVLPVKPLVGHERIGSPLGDRPSCVGSHAAPDATSLSGIRGKMGYRSFSTICDYSRISAWMEVP